MSKESKAGKVTCRILKEIRQQIANANDIKFVTSKCRYQGDCLGTCPKCEAEIHYLEQQLLSRRMAGLNVKVIGVSLGLSTLFSSPLYGQETLKDSLKDTSNILPQIEVIGYKSVTKVTVCGGLSIVEAEEKHVVKGFVVDKCGNPLIGAVVTERGMNNSTTTDREGHFLLRVRKGRSVLEVSSEGMKTKKIKVRKKKVTKIKVVLRKDKHRYKQTINANL